MTGTKESDCEEDDCTNPLLPITTTASSSTTSPSSSSSSSPLVLNSSIISKDKFGNNKIKKFKNDFITSLKIIKCQRNNIIPSSISCGISSSNKNRKNSIINNNNNNNNKNNKNNIEISASIIQNSLNKRKQFILIIIMVIILVYFNSSVIVWDRRNIEKIPVYHRSHVPGMKDGNATKISAQSSSSSPVIKTNIINTIKNSTVKTFTTKTNSSSISTNNKKIMQLLNPNYKNNKSIDNNNVDVNPIHNNLNVVANYSYAATTPSTIITKNQLTTTTIMLSSSSSSIIMKSTINSTILSSSSSTTTTTTTTTPNSNNSINLIPPPGYLVWSDKCKMPNMDPYIPEVMKHFKRQPYKPCTTEQPHTKISFNETSKKYILHLNNDIQTKYTKGGAKLKCSYQAIERSGSGKNADRNYKLSNSLDLPKTTQLPNTTEFILVTCKSSNNQTYMNVHAMMPEKTEIRNKLNEWKKKDIENGKRPVSVLFIGIDSVSRLNLIRAMPKTAQYIYDNEWFELSGYNKIDDNTFPNLMAVLAGLNNTHAFEKYNPKEAGRLDKCPLVWKNFRRLGYVTAYAEDETSISTFNYLKVGFEKQPTDYYLRPSLMVAEKKLPTKSKSGLTFCVGYKHSADYIMDYALELGTRYKDDAYFGFFWMNTFSHNAISDCSSMDDRIVEYFKKFSNNGIFNSSVIIFISDHGMRFGPTRILESGYYEERLPLAFLWLPPWLKDLHPEFVNALNANKNRLTNPYDMHMTLKHILELSGRVENLSLAEDCPNCQTLFRPVPENRSCQEISIADHWCTCLPFQSVHRDSAIVRRISIYTIDYINDYIKNYQNGSISNMCAKLHLHKIKSSNRAITTIGKKTNNNKLKTIETYHIIMIAKPGDGLFEASVRYHPNNDELEMTGSISRLNWYGKDSKCLQDGGAKKYCYCINVNNNHSNNNNKSNKNNKKKNSRSSSSG